MERAAGQWLWADAGKVSGTLPGGHCLASPHPKAGL